VSPILWDRIQQTKVQSTFALERRSVVSPPHGVSPNGLSSNPRRPLIEEVDPPVTENSPHQSGQEFDDAIDAVFERGD
jgi:hypothetical protein